MYAALQKDTVYWSRSVQFTTIWLISHKLHKTHAEFVGASDFSQPEV